MDCTSCGAKYNVNSTFCVKCGIALKGAESSTFLGYPVACRPFVAKAPFKNGTLTPLRTRMQATGLSGQPPNVQATGLDLFNTSQGDESGMVYLLVNRSMPGLVKIGRPSRSVDTRVRELSTATGVPTPFEVILDLFVRDSAKAERLVHKNLAPYHIAANREFFSRADFNRYPSNL